MYLEKLPKEDGEFKKVTHLKDIGHYIDVTVTSDLLRELDSESWLKAFQEHYNQATGESVDCRSYKNAFGRGIKIPPERPRIDFVVDRDHVGFKAWLSEKDEAARDIVYGFLERL